MTLPVPVDQAERDRVVGALHESLLVEAGAGTGKTTAVVARIANLLAEGVATVDDLAVVTFTKDAAAELVSRVRERLEEDLAAAVAPARRERLAAAQAGLYRARISTLHVFATTLLRERPVEARVDPGLRTIDALERTQLFDGAYTAWLGEILDQEHAALRTALNRGLQLTHLRTLCELVDGKRAALPLASGPPQAIDHAGVRDRIASIAAALAELAPQCQDAEDKGIVLYPALREFAEVVATTAGDDLALERAVLERTPKISPGSGAQGNWSTKEVCQEYKAAVGELKEAVGEYADALRGHALAALLPLAETFVNRFAEERRTAGLADFDDLLLWARDLLRRDAGARRWLRARYRHVLVDEFQDTDPLQAELALLLTSAGEAGDWRTLTPEAGSLVVVGDPKQSIYRFRSADIATYDAVRLGPLAGRTASLTQNFRSVGGLLAFSNHVFARVLGTGAAGRQAPHVALRAAHADRADVRRAPVVLVCDPDVGGDEKLKADEVRAREAELLARTLRLAIEVDGWTVRDGGGTRAATWGDVAILAPSASTALRTLGPAFEAHGIPFRSSAGVGLFLQPEIAELVNILHAVDDPTDAVHVVGALRSDAFGCATDDLVGYAALGARFDPRWIDEDGPKAVVDGLKALRAWRSERRGLSLAELVQRILDASGLVELALEQPGGAQAAGNLLRVVDEARAFAGTGGGLRAFTRHLAERQGEDTEATEAVVADPSDPVVRVMTIHGAKGLEFPIVALAGMDSKGSTQAPAAIARADQRRIELTPGGGFATPGYADLADDEKELLKLERDRLLYVAVTRAKDHLIIPAVRGREEAVGHLKNLMGSLPDPEPARFGTDIDGVHLLDPRTLPAGDRPAPTPPVAADSDAAELFAVLAAEEAWVAHRHEQSEHAARGLVQTVASSVRPFDRIRPLAATDTSTADVEAAVDLEWTPPLSIGSALHRVMDRVALDGASDPDTLVAAACLESGIPHATAELRGLVDACLASDAVRRAAESGTARREVPFTIPLPDGVGFAAGRADLIFRDGDELVVVDYKTDTLADASAATLAAATHTHSGQGLVYAAAVAQATGLAVREVVFVYPRVGEEWALAIDGQALVAAKQHLASGATFNPAQD